MNDNDRTALPLADMRVIDIGNVISMPYADGLTADLGAEVIKIERTAPPDTKRTNPNSAAYPDNDPGEDPWNRTGTTAYCTAATNRGRWT